MHKLLFLLTLLSSGAIAQPYTTASVFAHNDYVNDVPFYNSYGHHVGYMEADVFLRGDELMVAHTAREINPQKTLEVLYLKPLAEEVKHNGGYAYAEKDHPLVLMIDLKTEGMATLTMLEKKLRNYPVLTSSGTLQVVVSGDMPDTAQWKNFPSYIMFDGRPGIQYSVKHLKRVAFISTAFRPYSNWNGEGSPLLEDIIRIKALRDDVHAQGKKLRFWGAPDTKNAWLTFMQYEIDIIGTDHVDQLVALLKDQ